MTFIQGEKAWETMVRLREKLQNKFDVYYKPHYKNCEPIKVDFDWIINRSYCNSYSKTHKQPPYYEVCISLPPDSKETGNWILYKPPHFIWNDENGLKEIFLSPKPPEKTCNQTTPKGKHFSKLRKT